MSTYSYLEIKTMAPPASPFLNLPVLLSSAALLAVAYSLSKLRPRQTSLVLYVHDYLSGEGASAAVVAGNTGANSDVFHFGTVIVVDDAVTEGPAAVSKVVGRAQGMYVNSALDGKALHMVFSVVFTEGAYKGSSLEIQGADLYSFPEREFSIVSGTGYFRFVKGYGIMTTEFMDIVNARAVLKLAITLKHY